MKLYKLDQDVMNFQSYCYVNDDEEELTKGIMHGEPLDSWRRIALRPDDYHIFPESGDFPYILGTPMVSEPAKHTLQDECKDTMLQFLEAFERTSGQRFYFLNVLTKLPALDRDKTVFEYFEEYLVGVEKYHFRTDIAYPPLFRCYLDANTVIFNDVFATDELRQIVDKSRLKGFQFTEIWDSEEKRDRRFSWSIEKRKDGKVLISGTIFVNGVGPYPTKKCILNSDQIRWLCSELRKLKPDDLSDEHATLGFVTKECELYVSILNENACIIINPLWHDKKLLFGDNLQIPFDDTLEPFLLDLEKHTR